MILLFLMYFRVPFDWNNMSIYVVKYIYVDIGMIFSCQHNCMSMTALIIGIIIYYRCMFEMETNKSASESASFLGLWYTILKKPDRKYLFKPNYIFTLLKSASLLDFPSPRSITQNQWSLGEQLDCVSSQFTQGCSSDFLSSEMLVWIPELFFFCSSIWDTIALIIS